MRLTAEMNVFVNASSNLTGLAMEDQMIGGKPPVVM
jgi:hypothetical protein